MTELYEYYLKHGRMATKAKIKEMDSGVLVSELDDTLQFDIFKLDNMEWLTLPNQKIYQMLLSEIRDRLK